eukprot:scaffold15118_cov118-Skeletonema_menzelii.AAC.3
MMLPPQRPKESMVITNQVDYTLLSDEEELYVRFCAFQSERTGFDWKAAQRLPLKAPDEVGDVEEEVETDEEEDLDVVVFGAAKGELQNPRRRAAQLLFAKYKKRQKNGTLQALPDNYNPFELIERDTNSFNVLYSLNANVSNQPSSLPPTPRQRSAQSRVASRSPIRQTPSSTRAAQAPRSPWHSSNNMSTDNFSSASFSDSTEEYLVFGTNARGSVCVKQSDVSIPGGNLVDKILVLIAVHDASIYKNRSTLNFRLNDEGDAIIASLPKRTPIDEVGKLRIAAKASENAGTDATQLNRLILDGMNHIFGDSNSKQVKFPVPGDRPLNLDLPFATKIIYFPEGLTCNNENFNGTKKGSPELQFEVIPFHNIKDYKSMATFYNNQYYQPCFAELAKQAAAAAAASKGNDAVPDPLHLAHSAAVASFESFWANEVMKKLPNTTAYVKLELQLNLEGRKKNYIGQQKHPDADEDDDAALLTGFSGLNTSRLPDPPVVETSASDDFAPAPTPNAARKRAKRAASKSPEADARGSDNSEDDGDDETMGDL